MRAMKQTIRCLFESNKTDYQMFKWEQCNRHLDASRSQILMALDFDPDATVSSSCPNLTDSTGRVCPLKLYIYVQYTPTTYAYIA